MTPRLLSLWDIMDLFNVPELKRVSGMLEGIIAYSDVNENAENKCNIHVFLAILGAVIEFCGNHGFETCRQASLLTWRRLNMSNSVGLPVINAEAQNIIFLLDKELHNFQFLSVQRDRHGFIDNELLFGELVLKSFPSAKGDIVEAGNCMAAECGTAAVFHFMRATEFALRELAKDRNIEFKDKPLEQKEWGQIIPKLDSVVKTLRDTPTNQWKNPKHKEAQLHFYSELMPDLRSFNEAWRRHISHADTSAFYDRHQALSIFNHVKAFFQKLSTRINEGKYTPEYWDFE